MAASSSVDHVETMKNVILEQRAVQGMGDKAIGPPDYRGMSTSVERTHYRHQRPYSTLLRKAPKPPDVALTVRVRAPSELHYCTSKPRRGAAQRCSSRCTRTAVSRLVRRSLGPGLPESPRARSLTRRCGSFVSLWCRSALLQNCRLDYRRRYVETPSLRWGAAVA
jgi:hypothetical protein